MHRSLAILVITFVTLVAPLASAEAKSIEETVREYYKDIPIMIEIARCESKFRQFNADGTPLRGGWGGGMIGVFQFFERVHVNTALSLGFDLTTLEGNLGYAKHVHSTSGTTPWNSSKTCWGNAVSAAKPLSASKESVEIEAKVKLLKELVAQLQELLEKKRKLSLK